MGLRQAELLGSKGGSEICKKCHPRITEQFQNNDPQCRIVQTLTISPSTVHNIIKIF